LSASRALETSSKDRLSSFSAFSPLHFCHRQIVTSQYRLSGIAARPRFAHFLNRVSQHALPSSPEKWCGVLPDTITERKAMRRSKLLCVPLFIGACVLFYMGTTMLFLVPGDPGENYFRSLIAGRFLYGVLPTVSSALLMALIGWLWAGSHGDTRRSIKLTYWFVAGAVLLFWIGLIIRADLRDGFR
jgi:hypothetical protein